MPKFRVRGYIPECNRPRTQWAKAYPIIEAENSQDAWIKFSIMFPGYVLESITEEI